MNPLSRLLLSTCLLGPVAPAQTTAPDPIAPVQLDPIAVTSARTQQPPIASTGAKPPAQPVPAHDDAAKAKHCGCACCTGRESCCCNEEAAPDAAKPDPAERHPLKGVIVDVDADRSSLLVKHEAIPGYMMAMTMLFKVDAATLQAAQKGQAITATLVEREDGLWLEDVKPAAP